MSGVPHTYPSHYKPGTHWATDEAWRILDTLPVGALASAQRAYVAGLIAGTLMRVRSEERERLQVLTTAASGAWHALKSYEYGNAAPDLAQGATAALKAAIETVGGRLS